MLIQLQKNKTYVMLDNIQPVLKFHSACMVDEQGVAAPDDSSRFWDSCAFYISCCIIV
jgi:hypothetical protein